MVSIILPVFNESASIIRILKQIRSELDQIEYEIIVVDDGSTDNTVDLIHNYMLGLSNIELISYNPNRGKGYALKTGFREANFNEVFFLDSDLDILIDNLHRIIAQIDRYDLIITSKWMAESSVSIPYVRRIMSKVFNFLVRLLTGIRYRDTQVGLKFLKKDRFQSFIESSIIDRFAFDVELILYAQKNCFDILEMPVNISIDTSSLSIGDIFIMFRDVLRISYFWSF